jgi:glycosyltransferase involved in cell wall biosynthesis
MLFDGTKRSYKEIGLGNMRILVITPYFFPKIGGAELGIYEIYRRLSKDHDVRVLCPFVDKKFDENYPINFDLVNFKDNYGFHKLMGHKIINEVAPPVSYSAFNAVKSNIIEFDPDIINLHYAIPYGPAVIKHSKACPVVLSIVGREVPGPNTPFLWKYYIRNVIKNVTDTIYITKYCRTQIFGNNYTKGHIISYGVDASKFKSAKDESNTLREDMDISSKSTVLFALQRLDREKRVDIIIESFAILNKEYKNIKLIIGGTGPEGEELKKLSRSLGLEKNILFTGYIGSQDLPQYLNMSDIFVFHSTFETFGIVLAEAMMAKKPIVSVNNTAIPEVVEDGKSGLVVEPLNPSALASAISKLIEDEGLREKMARYGYDKAFKEYNWDTIAIKYEQVLKKASMGN